ncbi:MAG TPA: hypothetical protein VF796_14230 [Humisphaera sp.]
MFVRASAVRPFRALLAAGAVILPVVAVVPAVAAAEGKPAVAAPAAAANVPADIVGSWKYGSISPLWVKELDTGKVSTAGSMGSFYEFAADGSFKHFVYIGFNASGWKNGTFTEHYGTASFDPQKGTVTLTVTRGKYRVWDNRVQKNNYVRDMTDEEVKKAAETVTYRVAKGDDGKPRLEVGHKDGKGSTSHSVWER